MLLQKKEQKITFGWDLCHSCNYCCPYCGVWKENKNDEIILSVEQWYEIWYRIYEKYGSCHIYMSGGEPSTYPNFYQLVKKLCEIHSVEICTNLSFEVELLIQEISPEVLTIAPTFHPTFEKFEIFFEKIKKVINYLPNSQVYYVAYPGQINEMPSRSKKFKEIGVNLIPIPLRGDGYVLNNEEEKKIIEEISPYKGQKINYQLQKITPKGKLCNAGHLYAVVRTNGSVDRCSQYNDGRVGNFLDKNFKLFDKPTICEKDYCPIESQWIVEI
jgi:MoaA/NifB/PqqE/SkfB family radical SAM enzyme